MSSHRVIGRLSRTSVVLGSTIALCCAGASVAFAVGGSPSSSPLGVFTGCLVPGAGLLLDVTVSPTKPVKCLPGQTKVTWNAAGAPGSPGPSGPSGPAGATGPPGASGPAGPAGTRGPVGSTGPSGPSGPAGPSGATGPSGPSGPAGASGPSGLPGTNGATILNGSTPPSSDVGNIGDFYLDTTTFAIYGPKSAGGWASGQPLIGPQGPIGSPGPSGATGASGVSGASGQPGSQGPSGPSGPAGPSGPSGPAGPAGAGTILAASNGVSPAVVTTGLSGIAGTVSVLPLTGAEDVSSVPLSLVDGSIALSGPGSPGGMLQTFPRDATITSLFARTSVQVGLTEFGSGITLEAQLFIASSPGSATPVAGAVCLSPPLVGAILTGTVSTCSTTGLNIPIAAGTAGFIVIRAISSDPLSAIVTMNVSASLTVS